ncbi:MAG: hypothetical protein ACOC06_05735 [Halorubrum sp.]
MSDTITCPDCGEVAESIDDLERSGTVTEVAEAEGGRIRLYENHDLFLCSGCRKPLGISRP